LAPATPVDHGPAAEVSVADVAAATPEEDTTLVPVVTVDQGVGTTPPEKLEVAIPARPKRMRTAPPQPGMKLETVGINFFQPAEPYAAGERRSQRQRVRRLDHWMNEKVRWARPKGTQHAEIAEVRIAVPDLSPLEDTPERGKSKSPSEAIEDDAEALASSTPEKETSSGTKRKLSFEDEAKLAASGKKASRTSGGGRGRSGRASFHRRDSIEEAEGSGARSPDDACTFPEGFTAVDIAPGSKYPCAIRLGVDSGWGSACDIRIPPESFNMEECLSAQSIFVTVIHAALGALQVRIDGEEQALQKGDQLVVSPGQSYSFRNTAKEDYASLKMIVALGRQRAVR